VRFACLVIITPHRPTPTHTSPTTHLTLPAAFTRSYKEFIAAMRVNELSGNINVPATITTVRRLFEGHPSLLEGFLQFLPAGYVVAVPAAVAPAAVASAAAAPAAVAPAAVAHVAAGLEFTATRYVNAVRARFGTRSEGPYKHFLRLLDRYHRGIRAGETQDPALWAVMDSVVTLFRGHADLQRGFLHFLPDVLQEEARARFDRSIEAANAVAVATAAAEGTVAPLRRTTRKVGPRSPAQGLQTRVERVLATYEARHGGAPGDAAGAALAVRLQRALDEWREHEGAGAPGAAEVAGDAAAAVAEVPVASATVAEA
jgi:hypothetical protein